MNEGTNALNPEFVHRSKYIAALDLLAQTRAERDEAQESAAAEIEAHREAREAIQGVKDQADELINAAEAELVTVRAERDEARAALGQMEARYEAERDVKEAWIERANGADALRAELDEARQALEMIESLKEGRRAQYRDIARNALARLPVAARPEADAR